MNPTKKDVIYIDIEDDITAIIGKVKVADSKIVALVPPKRIGVLQSAVNLKLLQKSAQSVGKRVVLITNDHSLTSLAAGIKIPVAKNLQSRPEIPQLDAPQTDDEEVINGEELPIGDIAAAAGAEPPTAKPPETATSTADNISEQVDLRNLSAAKPAKEATKGKGKNKISIPNFNTFRKKLFLIGGGALLLIGFIVWALAFAPRATVTISAKTNAINIDQPLTLNPALPQSKVADFQLKPETKQIKKAAIAEFDATGSKETGDKAAGTLTMVNAADSDSISVPAGTTVTAASGQKFTTSGAVTVPGAKVSGGQIQPGTATVGVQAAAIGPDHNIPAQTYTVEGQPDLNASGTAMSGGSKQTVTVVSQDDVNKAKSQLTQQDSSTVKSDLRKQFSGDFIIIDESFMAEQGSPSASPAVGEQAKRAKLTVETTYTLMGLPRKEVNDMLNSSLKDDVEGKPNQSIFSNGANDIQFQAFQKFDGGTFGVRLVTTGYIGSKIDADELARELAGKRYGEIQQIVNQIPNIDNVDIKFSPFWVNTAPSDPKKVDIKFTILNDTE